MHQAKSIAVVGGGPAGLRAAEVAAEHGASVTLYEAKRSVGRKFLVAGKSGLNLTNGEAFPDFLKHYKGPELPAFFYEALKQFNNDDLRNWAAELGIETYVASSNKVFPVGMKAAPLLRRWIERLRQMGVKFRVRHKLTSINAGVPHTLRFLHDSAIVDARHDAVILALGGASWPSTGSDGKWVSLLEKLGVSITPLSSANCGWETKWPTELLESAEGLPLKNIVVHAGDASQHGELVITKYGLEGGPIYKLGPEIRNQEQPHVLIDLKPTFTVDQLAKKMESVKRNHIDEAKTRWKLSPAAHALFKYNLADCEDVRLLAEHAKSCRVNLTQPRPIEEAISSAGGIQWQNFNQSLELQSAPNIYLAGEMLDWEAPTGGFLLQAAFATGTAAAVAAIENKSYFRTSPSL